MENLIERYKQLLNPVADAVTGYLSSLNQPRQAKNIGNPKPVDLNLSGILKVDPFGLGKAMQETPVYKTFANLPWDNPVSPFLRGDFDEARNALGRATQRANQRIENDPMGVAMDFGPAGIAGTVRKTTQPLVKNALAKLPKLIDDIDAKQILHLTDKMQKLGNISIEETRTVYDLAKKLGISPQAIRGKTADGVLAELSGLVSREQGKLPIPKVDVPPNPIPTFDIPKLDGLNGFDIPKLDVTGKRTAIKGGQELFGGVAGIEFDEEGNIGFDPAKAALGIAGIGSVNALRNKSSVKSYVRDMAAKQRGAQAGTGILASLKSLRGEFKRKFVDETSALSDILTNAEKRSKFKVLPSKDVRYQIDRALRADTLATQFAKDHGLLEVIKRVDDLDTFNQYLIAKHALRVSKKGIKTGRNTTRDRELVQTLASHYKPFEQQIRAYNDALLRYKVDTGFITQELAQALRREYPDYVPLQRVFSQLEEAAMRQASGRGGPASVSTQAVIKRLKGSTREIVNPLESVLENTAVAFRQGERNRAAQMLIAYKDLPGNPFGLRKLTPGEATTGKHTISAFINGQKLTYEALPEVVEAAKNLTPVQLGILGQILSVPTRVLRLGAVGVNLPFVASNIVRDQAFSAVTSRQVRATANPITFLRSFYQVLTRSDLYDEWVRSGASFNQFEIGRGSTAPTVARVRADRSAASRVAYTVTHPRELLTAVENIIGRAEEVTRVQQFAGTRDALIAQGRTPTDARILAGDASRFNTANFARKGEWGKVLNTVIPFFNAGIQGSRSLVRSASQNPGGTAARFAITIGLPTATVTAWNLADPRRQEAYADIPDYEKEGNLIILPPVPTQDADGNWNAIKIPVTPGLSNLMAIVRRGVEGVHGMDPGSTAQALTDLVAAGTSIDLGNPNKLISSVTPQAVKPLIEAQLNKNLYTGKDIVPRYMQDELPQDQVYDSTSGTARLIGKSLNQSPILTEHLINTTTAGVGRQAVNLSDRLLASQGVISEDEVGGRSVAEDFSMRFTKARGGETEDRIEREADERIERLQRGEQIGAITSEGTLLSEAEARAQERVARKQVELQGGTAQVNGKIFYENDNGAVTSIDIGKFEQNATGIKRLALEKEKIATARTIYGIESLEREQKLELLKKLGVSEQDAHYDYLANQDSDIKAQFLYEQLQGMSHDQAVLFIAQARKQSISGVRYANDATIDYLAEIGFLSDEERRALKKIDLDKKGRMKSKASGRGRRRAAVKLAIPKARSAPTSVKHLKIIDTDYRLPKRRRVKAALTRS